MKYIDKDSDILLHVRWTEDIDLSFQICPFLDTPATIKSLITQAAPYTSNKKLRLIYNGKILDNDNIPLCDYGLQTSGVFIHCAVSEHIQYDVKKPAKKKVNSTSGFDRLLASGFNHEEIGNIRTHFHRSHNTVYADDQEAMEQLQQIEEQWMQQTGETIPEGALQGTYKEMMWGLMLGFFLGILCIFWIRESVFTRRHQVGILVGMLLNTSIGYMHVYH